MAEKISPRQMARDILQGIAPPRPLFLPIVFSLGARVESLPLRAFLANPTKICNAQRQIRGRLPADGVTCYFDPFLEVEGLGAVLRWESDNRPPVVCWPRPANKGELPAEGLRSPEEAVKAGRIGVAAEVIRRLSALLRDDTLLMAGVSGPFTLAAQLLQLGEQELGSADAIVASALDLAMAMVTQTASVFVEAGAHVIFIHEGVLPPFSAESADDWATRLSPAFNIIRFYGALPALLLTNLASVAQNFPLLAARDWEGIFCPALDSSSPAGCPPMDSAKLGLAVPPGSFPPSAALVERIRGLRPAIITTAGDVPPAAGVKQLAAMCEEVCR